MVFTHSRTRPRREVTWASDHLSTAAVAEHTADAENAKRPMALVIEADEGVPSSSSLDAASEDPAEDVPSSATADVPSLVFKGKLDALQRAHVAVMTPDTAATTQEQTASPANAGNEKLDALHRAHIEVMTHAIPTVAAKRGGGTAPPPAATSPAKVLSPRRVLCPTARGNTCVSPRKALSPPAKERTRAEAASSPTRGIVEEKLDALYRAHLGALRGRAGASSESDSLKRENAALKAENDCWRRENIVLKREFGNALRDNEGWCRENELLQKEYTEAFLAKTSEIFEQTVALETENEARRRESDAFRAKTDAACLEREALKRELAEVTRKHADLVLENKAWQYENKVLHEEYAEHLSQSVDILKGNTALKAQIASSNQEYARTLATQKVYVKSLMDTVRHALTVGQQRPQLDEQPVPRMPAEKMSIDTIVEDWSDVDDEHEQQQQRRVSTGVYGGVPRLASAETLIGEFRVNRSSVPPTPAMPAVRTVDETATEEPDAVATEGTESGSKETMAEDVRRGVDAIASIRRARFQMTKSCSTETFDDDFNSDDVCEVDEGEDEGEFKEADIEAVEGEAQGDGITYDSAAHSPTGKGDAVDDAGASPERRGSSREAMEQVSGTEQIEEGQLGTTAELMEVVSTMKDMDELEEVIEAHTPEDLETTDLAEPIHEVKDAVGSHEGTPRNSVIRWEDTRQDGDNDQREHSANERASKRRGKSLGGGHTKPVQVCSSI